MKRKPKRMHSLLTLCAVFVVALTACTPSTVTTPPPTMFRYTPFAPPTPDIDFLGPFREVWPYPDSEMPVAIYDEWRGSPTPSGVNFTLSPLGFNPLVADETGKIVYAEPHLYVDGTLIASTDLSMRDYLGLTCIVADGIECEGDQMVGTGPFEYRYSVALNSGMHEARVQWEAHDGQIYEYSWSFTLIK